VNNMVARALEMEGTCTVSFKHQLCLKFADDVDRGNMALALERRKHC